MFASFYLKIDSCYAKFSNRIQLINMIDWLDMDIEIKTLLNIKSRVCFFMSTGNAKVKSSKILS